MGSMKIRDEATELMSMFSRSTLNETPMVD